MNQQTHDILLHLANTQEMHGEVMALLSEHRDRYDFSNALRDYVENELYGEDPSNDLTLLQQEVISTHLSEVRWNEVADDYFDEYNNIAGEQE
jgi:hypothetical protein